jgi:hypothetical protein
VIVPLGEAAPADTPVTTALSVSAVPDEIVPGLLSESTVLLTISVGWITTVAGLEVDVRKYVLAT